ncbi:MAG: hypothetical protein OEW58_05210 [Gammaproteobacteria bacterium]|nr:hypothetical protein [Gammaproteobacteria bacterium]
MSKTLKVKDFSCLPLLGLSLLMAIPAAHAAPPIKFDSWHVDNSGKIVAQCPIGFNCFGSTTSQGMFQQTVITPEGKRYVQNIVYDKDKTQGLLTDENFVNIDPINNGGNGGISGKQVIKGSNTQGDYDSVVLLNLGWAASNDAPEILIDSTIFGTGREKRGRSQGTYYEHFRYEGEKDREGNDLGSFTLTRSELGASKDRKVQAWQVFETRIATGTRVANAGAITTTDEGVPSFWSGRRGPGNVNDNSGYLGSSDPTPVDNWAKAPKTNPGMGPNVGGSPGPGSGGRPISGGDVAKSGPFGSFNYDPTGDTDGANLQVAGRYAGTVRWNPGDKVQTVYIGQDLGSGVGAFSFQAFDNLSNTESYAAIRKLRDTTPTVWTMDPFGPLTGMKTDGLSLANDKSFTAASTPTPPGGTGP